MANTDFDPKNIPPASFSFLVTTLGAQGAVALGMAPNPMTNKTEVQPELGKHAIDTLGILQEKTKGNLTGDETQLLRVTMRNLRAKVGRASPGRTWIATEYGAGYRFDPGD